MFRGTAAKLMVDNSIVVDTVSKARNIVQGQPLIADESSLRSVEGILRGKLVCLNHELMYLLRARDLYLFEHEQILARLEDRSNIVDLSK